MAKTNKFLSVKTSLFLSFFSIVLILLIPTIFFVVAHSRTEDLYRRTINSTILEYSIAETTNELVASFGFFIRDIESEKSMFEFNVNKQKIETTFLELDPVISLEESTIIYSRLKNSVAFLNEYFEKGIENIQKKNFAQMSEIMEQIERAQQNIKSTTTALVLSELNFSKQKQIELDAMERLIWIFGMALIVITTVGALVTAFLLSRKVSIPLARLSKLAEDISGGNLSLNVENDLLGRGDEIGSLSESLAVMLEILKRKIHETEASLEATKKLERALEKEKESVERKVVERTHELNEEHAKLVASINSLSLGFFITDEHYQLALHNEALGEILNISKNGATIEEITKSFGNAFDLRMYSERCMQERKIVEIKDIQFGNKFLHIFLTPILMFHDSGEIIGYTALVEDVTEAKAVERSREEFFSIASHELRTPLTVIRGNASLIEDFYMNKIKDNTVAKMVSDIHEASVRLIKIIGDFLDISRLEQGRVTFEKIPFDALGLTYEVLDEMRGVADAHGLYMRLENAGMGEIPVVGDRDKMKQALLNLITNGINYTHTGGVTVTLKKEDGFLKIFVRDTGIGIPEENQLLLFRKFQQAGKEVFTRNVTRGTGLGLYISKLLIEGMGGTIGLLESHPDEGSTFNIIMPLAVV